MTRADSTLFSLVMVGLAACSATGSFAQSLLQITSPYGGQIYQEGQTYTITLTADPSVQNIFAVAQDPFPQPTSNPTQFTITLPKNIPLGTYQIGAVGNTAITDVEVAPVQPA